MAFGVWRNGALERRISVGEPFNLDGMNYPSNWLQCTTPAEQSTINIFPIVYSNSAGNASLYTVTEGSPSLSGGQIVISYVNSLKSAATVAAVKMNLLNSQVNSVFNSGVTVGAKTYPADPASLLFARQAISDVSSGLTLTSYIPAIDGSVTTITAANVAAARSAMVTFITAVGAKRLSYYNQIQSFSASGDASSLLTLDLTQGWPS